MASNSQPDIFYTWEAGFLQPFVDGGRVYPVGEIFEADEEWQNAFPDKSVFGPLTFDGAIYAVPNVRQICVIAYNKDLLNEANEREIDPKSIVQIVVKGNTFNLVYAE